MKKSVGVNAVLNILKQISGILFPVIVFPYILRHLGSDNYGKVSFSLSVISYFIMLAGLGISTYAIREGSRIRDDKKNIEQFINEVFSINILCAVVSYSCFILSMFIVSKFSEYRLILIIQSLAIIMTTLGSDWVNQIYEDYGYITFRYILCQIITLIPIFFLVKNENDYIRYAFISLFASYGGNLLNVFYIRRYVKRKFTIKRDLLKHLKPILILFSGIIAIHIYVNSDITMLGFMRTESEVGIYSAISKIYSIAKQLVNAITVVAIPRISMYLSLGNRNKYNNLVNRLFTSLITLALPASVGLFFLSQEVILLISGKEYIAGAHALKILCIAFPFSLLSGYFINGILVPNRKEKYVFLSTMGAALINIILNVFVIPKFGMSGAAFTTLIAEAFVMISAIMFSRGAIPLSFSIKQGIILAIANIGVVSVCILTRNISNTILHISVSVLGSVFVYFVILYMTKTKVLS